jgi:hypothetical protein
MVDPESPRDESPRCPKKIRDDSEGEIKGANDPTTRINDLKSDPILDVLAGKQYPFIKPSFLDRKLDRKLLF